MSERVIEMIRYTQEITLILLRFRDHSFLKENLTLFLVEKLKGHFISDEEGKRKVDRLCTLFLILAFMTQYKLVPF